MFWESRDPGEADRGVESMIVTSSLTQLQAIPTRQINYFQFAAIFKWKKFFKSK